METIAKVRRAHLVGGNENALFAAILADGSNLVHRRLDASYVPLRV